ncbi:MAG: endonuclease/exonuclease/phosphatase family protein [Candidatus Sungbacteria bacterium]|uniref:Endonuclease/exonuclease/phosphatase family protein n=1 Tax=Candidatus Sungiibacteriota bacterium TaxID=2750080 RepID=A0A932QXR2_9BACT|nr:endonuclease/exonuclease/phosphatase family protein [Candidatus Sungbacteria bacterium]
MKDISVSKIRIVSFNVFYALRKKRLQHALSETLARMKPDVVCLQEVWAGKKSDFARELARLLNYHLLFSRRAAFAGRRIGIASLMREPSRRGSSVILPRSHRSRPRVLQLVTLQTNHISWRIANTHLSVISFRARKAQLAAILEALDALERQDCAMPTILVGDFNTRTKKEVDAFARMLTENGFQIPQMLPHSWNVLGIRRQLDWIAARHCSIVAMGAIPHIKGSDHKPVWADIVWHAAERKTNPRRIETAQ